MLMGSKKREHCSAFRNKSSTKKNPGPGCCCRSCVCGMGYGMSPLSGNLHGENSPEDPSPSAVGDDQKAAQKGGKHLTEPRTDITI